MWVISQGIFGLELRTRPVELRRRGGCLAVRRGACGTFQRCGGQADRCAVIADIHEGGRYQKRVFHLHRVRPSGAVYLDLTVAHIGGAAWRHALGGAPHRLAKMFSCRICPSATWCPPPRMHGAPADQSTHHRAGSKHRQHAQTPARRTLIQITENPFEVPAILVDMRK